MAFATFRLNRNFRLRFSSTSQSPEPLDAIIMTTGKHKEKTIRDNGNLIRAEVIQNALQVEDILTEALGLLYAPDRNEYAARTLIEEILSDLTFDKKIKLFKKYVDIFSEEFNHCPNIIKQLNNIRDTRNQLAHRTLSFPWIFDENEIDNNDYDTLFNLS